MEKLIKRIYTPVDKNKSCSKKISTHNDQDMYFNLLLPKDGTGFLKAHGKPSLNLKINKIEKL